VVTVELAPVAVAPPAPPRDLAAGPLLETESQERVAEEAPAPPERKEPEKEKQEKVGEEPPAPDPEVAMAPEPPPEEGPIEHKPAPVQALAAPVPTAPQSAPAPAERAAAPAIAPTPTPTSAVVASWQRLLVAQLERHKRYPPQARGKVGEARLAVRHDPTRRAPRAPKALPPAGPRQGRRGAARVQHRPNRPRAREPHRAQLGLGGPRS